MRRRASTSGGTPGSEHVFRQQRQMIERNSKSILNGVKNGGCWPIHRQLANSLGAHRSMRVRNLFEENAYRWHVHGSGNDVVGELVIGHRAIAPEHFFIECIANAL